MAKFNKDTFLNDITTKVQSAIDKNLITHEDVEKNQLDRLHGFIQYELLQYIEDRKFAIDVLKDFNYDEKAPWENLQAEYGTFKSLLDIALVNLWKFLTAEGATKFAYYNHDNKQDGKPMLDMIHDLEDIPGNRGEDVEDDTTYTPSRTSGSSTPGFHPEAPGEDDEDNELNPIDFSNDDTTDFFSDEEPEETPHANRRFKLPNK